MERFSYVGKLHEFYTKNIKNYGNMNNVNCSVLKQCFIQTTHLISCYGKGTFYD